MRTKGSSRLSSNKRKELMISLCRALSTLQTPKEVADALSDLLTPKETETIAKRLQIAEYLVDGKDYDAIRSILNVGYSTISRINTWLNLSGEGFRVMLQRKKNSPAPVSDDERYDPLSWHNIKRRYSMNFWPQLLLEELIRNADTKERAKINAAMEKLAIKAERFTASENKRLYDSFSAQVKHLSSPKHT